MGRFELRLRVLHERLSLLGGERAVGDEPGGVLLAHGGLLRDPRHHQRLRVGRLVLFLMAEAPVADEVDDDVVPELVPVGHREPDRGDRRLGVVGVDVDDRNVEALGEVR